MILMAISKATSPAEAPPIPSATIILTGAARREPLSEAGVVARHRDSGRFGARSLVRHYRGPVGACEPLQVRLGHGA
jgi:hypothetical protein